MTKNNTARHTQAVARQADRNQRTPEEQVEVLDARLGKGRGATRERTRLAARVG